MGKFIDITGQKFGRLTVLKLEEIRNTPYGKRTMWRCRCDCGKEVVVYSYSIRTGKTLSCGCYNRELVKNMRTKHNDAIKNSLYGVWLKIKDRCLNPKSKSYKFYGAKGVLVCDEWKNDYRVFKKWACENGYKREKLQNGRNKLTIDRINPCGNYEPNNCRWITIEQQQRNKRNNVYITYNGRTLVSSEWDEIMGFNKGTIAFRLRSGWTKENALLTPIKSSYNAKYKKQEKENKNDK